ncbi:ABC transporter ATP-binding protein [Desertibaculum subflavum]|uniref:ABC transporter ATP-binding protein n=1 Tax=Desertibaculum subflavum TaxID=2268458 RepID=UPI000E66E09A
MSDALSLETVGLTKRFGAFTALDAVSIKVRAGSLHALLGENGAGKSTLVKCVMGYYHADDGDVLIGDRGQEIGSPRAAAALGLGMVYQHFTLVPNMSVAENLLLASGKVPAVVDWKAERAKMTRFMDSMPFRVPLDRPISALAIGEKQKVEILKQLYLDRRLLILDEPTSVLTPDEADEVLGFLRGLVDQGRLTIVMISHKLREIYAYAEEVSVLRQGKLVGAGRTADLAAPELTRMMVGVETLAQPAARAPKPAGDVVLDASGLVAADDRGRRALDGASLAVRAGEILGLAGVSGNGQRELVEILAGQRDPEAGAVKVHGERYAADRAAARKHKVVCLPEEPLKNASVPTMSVAENLALRRFDLAPMARGPWLSDGAIRRAAEKLIGEYRIRTRSPATPIAELSGGNVQRTVLARDLSEEIDLLVVANPCFGLDVKATAEIRAALVAQRNKGAAILLVSEDLDEILELSDRVAVIASGKIAYEAPIAAADRQEIGKRMVAH